MQQKELRFEVVVKASDDGLLRLEASGDVGEDRYGGLEELRALLEGLAVLARSASSGPWMTAKEAADFLRFPRSTFDAMAAAGEIPRHKRGAGYRYYEPELTEWLLAG